MMRNWILILPFAVAISGCIGTDVIDDPEVGERIEVTPDRVALLVGSSVSVMATYFNSVGNEQNANLQWTISPVSVAMVNSSGVVMGVAAGHALLSVSHNEISEMINVTVVQDETSAAIVEIAAEKTGLSIGEEVTLSAVVTNINGGSVTGSTIEWDSSDESVLTVDGDGVATAISNGIAMVTAKADGILSNEIEFSVGNSRMGTFIKTGGYDASGTATFKMEGDNLMLELSSDFMTSFALGTYIYLSNTITSGSAVRSSGVEISEITVNGTHTFNITEKIPGVTINDYKYVVILCKPAQVIFGYAEMN